MVFWWCGGGNIVPLQTIASNSVDGQTVRSLHVQDCCVYGFDATSGDLVFKVNISGNLPQQRCYIQSSPVLTLDGSKLFIGGGQRLWAIDVPRQKIIGSYQATGDVTRRPTLGWSREDIMGKPGQEDTVFVVSHDHHIYALDIKDVKRQRWNFSAGSLLDVHPTLHPSGAIIYIASSDKVGVTVRWS